MKTYEFDVKIKVDAKFFCYLLASAFEGGSNYWVKILNYKVPDSLEDVPTDFRGYNHIQCAFGNGHIELVESEEYYKWETELPDPYCSDTVDENEEQEYVEPKYPGQIFILNEAAMERGLMVMREKYPRHFQDAMSEDGDATTGDVFLQCCVLGEIVYG